MGRSREGGPLKGGGLREGESKFNRTVPGIKAPQEMRDATRSGMGRIYMRLRELRGPHAYWAYADRPHGVCIEGGRRAYARVAYTCMRVRPYAIVRVLGACTRLCAYSRNSEDLDPMEEGS